MNRRGWIVAACLVAAAGCGKKEKSKDQPKPQTSAQKADARGAKAALSRLPANADLLAVFNFQQLRTTAMWKTKPELFKGIAAGPIDDLMKRCNIDLMNQIDRVTVAQTSGDLGTTLILVEGKVTKSAVETCVAKDQRIKPSSDGGITTYQSDELMKPLHVGWLTDTTALVADNRMAVAALLDKPGGGPGARNAALMSKVNTGATMWAVGKVPGDLPLDMLGIPAAPKVFWVHGLYGDGMQLLVAGRFDNAEGAKGLERLIKSLAKDSAAIPPNLKSLFESLKVKRSGTELSITGRLRSSQVEAISNTAGGIPR